MNTSARRIAVALVIPILVAHWTAAAANPDTPFSVDAARGDLQAPSPTSFALLPPVVPWYRAPAVRWSSLVVGVASMVAGIALIAIDGRCAERGTVSPALSSQPYTCRALYHSAPMGYAMVGGGLVLDGIAAWLFYTDDQSSVGAGVVYRLAF